jgi:hypothetical protein
MLVQSLMKRGKYMTEARIVGVQLLESIRGGQRGVARGQVGKHQFHGVDHYPSPSQPLDSLSATPSAGHLR